MIILGPLTPIIFTGNMAAQRIIFTLLFLTGLQIFTLAQDRKLPSPPNGIWLHDNIFIDQTEVANLHWLEYLHYLKKDSSLSVYLRALPDTTVWDAIDTTGHYKENYFRGPAYQQFALVGISYAQALDYCRWRSAVVNERIAEEARKAKRVPAHRVAYRLPTIEEWEEAAAGKLNPKRHPFGYKRYLKKPELDQPVEELYQRINTELFTFHEFEELITRFKRKGRVPEFNCVKSVEGILTYSNLMPEPVQEPPKNSLDIYGMIGNVAEMTSSRGIAKGGSFLHRCEDCTISKVQEYTRPTPWLGFRCIAEVELLEEE
jgi:formylglycine-generating enzyme required for sulfatase activity